MAWLAISTTASSKLFLLSPPIGNRGARAEPVLLDGGGLGIIPILTKDNLLGLRMAIGKGEGRQAVVAGGNLVTGTVALGRRETIRR